MMHNSPAEKQQIKEAKKAFKSKQQAEKEQERKELIQFHKRILHGILPGEDILPDNHPVYLGHYYVIDDNDGTVVCSSIMGNIGQLKVHLRDLVGWKVENIRNCKLVQRNLLND